MEPSNLSLLESKESLQKLASRDLRGVFALRLADIIEAVNERLRRLQALRQDLDERIENGNSSVEEADEQWREVLEETLEIEEDPLPRSALRTVEISVGDLKALDWMIGDAEDDTDTE